MPILRTLALGAIAALSFAAAPALAQWTNPYSGRMWNNPGSSLLDTMIQGRVYRKMLLDSMGKEGEKGAAAPASKPAARPARITYRPSAASRVPEEFSASLLESKADRAELTRYLRQVMEVYAAKAREERRPHDVGHALTFFVAGNYAILHEQDVSDDATTALNQQLDQVLGPDLARASDAQKQQLAEYVVCSTFFALAGYQQGKQLDKPDQVRTYRDLAAMNLKAVLQVDAARIRLTEAGLQLD